jgi:hypothetical protein
MMVDLKSQSIHKLAFVTLSTSFVLVIDEM